LMTGEVRSLETTINNFFTNVSALLSQATADSTKSDGYHHYEEPEREPDPMQTLQKSTRLPRRAL